MPTAIPLAEPASPPPPSASPEQRAAIEAPPGPVLVLAGPGAGKTYCLIERVRYLIERCQAEPRRICCVTFTNKAAEEVAARLHREMGEDGGAVHRGTIHSLCCEILREHGEKVGVPRGFGIADEETQEIILRRLGVRVYKRRVWMLTQFGRRRLQGTAVEPDVAALCARYLEVLHARRLVDFDGLVLLVDQLFAADPGVAQAVAARWDHLLVDEFQDLNAPQYRIVRRLAEAHRSIFAVGDDEQSIFSWTGADPKVLDRFRTDFAITRPFSLEENHRCSREIFGVARRLVERNEALFAKKIVAVRDVPVPVVARAFPDERAEAEWIVADVCARRGAGARAHEDGLTWGDFGVLYRRHDIGDVLEQAFVQAGVPCRLARGRALTDDPVIGQVLASLRVIQEEGGPLAAEALAMRVFPESLLERVRAGGGDFLAAVRNIALQSSPGDDARRVAWRFVYQVENLRALAKTHTTLPALILEILGSRMGVWQNALEEKAEHLVDPAADANVVQLAASLEAATSSGRAVWVVPGGGAEIGVRGMLVRSELFREVRYRLGADRPEAGDLQLGPTNAELALRVFKALQLIQARAVRDPFPEFVAFDLETTSNDSATCEVVEIGAVRVANGEIQDTFRTLVRPRQPITPGAAAVHGYTMADLDQSPSFTDVWPAFRAFVGDRVLLAHNAQQFDVPVLRRLAAGLPGVDDLRFFDSLPLARAVITDGSAKLEVLAERFGVERGRAHHALDDARTLAGVYFHLARLQQVRTRKTAQVPLLDALGLALAADWIPAAPDGEERSEFQKLVVRFTLGRYSDALEFYAAERARAPELPAPPVDVIITNLGGRAKLEQLRRERSPSDRYATALARLSALVESSAADTLAESIGRLLERVALSTSREAETDPERVNLLTLHSTKGLEYSTVYVVGVEDEQLPGVRSGGDEGLREVEEARRLLYVGMTRARDRLVLTRVTQRGGKDAGGSVFLDEMGITAALQ